MSIENLFAQREAVVASVEAPKPEIDKDAYAAAKKEERDALYSIVDTATEEIFAEPKKFLQYLKMQSQHGKMSLTNVLLVMKQMPAATRLYSYEDWPDHGRNVKKYQKGISVFEATDQYKRPDGTIATGFRVTKLFDVSQTHGTPLRTPREEPLETKLANLMHSLPVKCVLSESLSADIGTQYDPEGKTIAVSKELLKDGEGTYRALALEAAHIQFAQITGSGYSKEDNAWFAQSAAAIVCQAQGVTPVITEDTPNLQGIEIELKDKRQMLADIRQTAVDVLDRISKARYQDQQQRRDDKAQER